MPHTVWPRKDAIPFYVCVRCWLLQCPSEGKRWTRPQAPCQPSTTAMASTSTFMPSGNPTYTVVRAG